MYGQGRNLGTGSIVTTQQTTESSADTKNQISALMSRIEKATSQNPQIWQGSSKFSSNIRLGKRASAHQGNCVTVNNGGDVHQEGCDYGGDISGDEEAQLSQGNKVDGQMSAENFSAVPE